MNNTQHGNSASTQTLRTVEMAYCARCYGYIPPRAHPVSELEPAMVFQPFGNPIIDSNGAAWTHWGTCPIAHAPVLMTDLSRIQMPTPQDATTPVPAPAPVPGATTSEFRMECAECGQPTTNRVAVTVGATRQRAWLCPTCWWRYIGEPSGMQRTQQAQHPAPAPGTAPA